LPSRFSPAVPLSRPGSIAEITAKARNAASATMYIADRRQWTSSRHAPPRDHVEYNDSTSQVIARATSYSTLNRNILKPTKPTYNVATGRGTFKKVAAS